MNAVIFFIFYITLFINSMCLIVAYSQLNNKSFYLTKSNLFFICVICLLMYFNNFYNFPLLKVICSIIITFIMEKKIFEMSVKETLINVFIITITCLIIEIVSTLALVSFANIEALNNNILFKVAFSLFTSLILLLIFNPKIIKLAEKIKNGILDFFNFYIFCLFIIFLMIIVCYFIGVDLGNIPLILTAIVTLLFIMFCLKIIINDKYNNKVLLTKNKTLTDSYKAYADTIEECRELKHNLKNDLYALKTSIPNDYQAQINKLIIKYNKEYEWINRIDEIPEGLQGVIYLKINEALRKKVKIILNTKKEVSTNDNDYMDLCSIVGLLIDNAIEASSLSKVKVIEINIIESKNQVYIKILNKFKNRIDVNKIGKKNYSTKVYKSGLGLNYIKKLNNSNIKVNFNIINDLFVTNVTYNQNKKA